MTALAPQRSLLPPPPSCQSAFTLSHSSTMRDAIKRHDSSVILSLLSQGFDPSLPLTYDKWNAFLLLIQEGETDLVRSLVESGVDVNYRDEDGFTGLMVAADRGDIAMVKALVSLGSDETLTYDGRHTAEHLALQSGRRAVAEFLSRRH